MCEVKVEDKLERGRSKGGKVPGGRHEKGEKAQIESNKIKRESGEKRPGRSND